MLPLLWEALRRSGYECLICYDQVDGITVYPSSPDATAAAERVLGKRVVGRRPSLARLRRHLAKVAGAPDQPPPEAEAARAGGGQGGGEAPDPAPRRTRTGRTSGRRS